jgi:hypothetical protein
LVVVEGVEGEVVEGEVVLVASLAEVPVVEYF